MMNTKKCLGILGGMGPLATAHFYELIIRHTAAERDSDHISVIVTGSSDIPDRTDYIMGRSSVSPAPAMIADAKKLEAAGAELIAIPCNTAHYFHDEILSAVDVPLLNIVEETVNHCKRRGFCNVGILATEGTVKIGAYKRALDDVGINCTVPTDDIQKLVTSVIYDYVKAGRDGGDVVFAEITRSMFALGCDALILGCTELPLVSPSDDVRLVDSLQTLAYAAITKCGCVPTGFSDEFLSAYED